MLLRESKPKKGSYTACYYVRILSRWHHGKRRPPYFSLMLRFPMYPMDYHLRVGFLLCLNENTRHQIRLCLLTRSSLISLSFLVFFKRKLGSIFEMNSSSLVYIVDTVVVVNSAISTERKAWTKFGREREFEARVYARRIGKKLKTERYIKEKRGTAGITKLYSAHCFTTFNQPTFARQIVLCWRTISRYVLHVCFCGRSLAKQKRKKRKRKKWRKKKVTTKYIFRQMRKSSCLFYSVGYRCGFFLIMGRDV